jgi:kynurenine formamidase
VATNDRGGAEPVVRPDGAPIHQAADHGEAPPGESVGHGDVGPVDQGPDRPADRGDVPPGGEASAAELDLDELYLSLRTWGRWGDDDQRGALNHLTDAHRAHAATLVRTGQVVSLAHDLATVPSAEAPFPAQHHMLASGDARDATGLPGYEGCGDWVGIQVHGLGITHVDALCHMFVRGEMYNGRPASDVRSDGARTNTIMALADGLVGRGVLLDVPRTRGVEWLDGDDVITIADLEATEQAQGVVVGTGDLLLVATGRDARRRAANGRLDPNRGLAGLHPECLPWLHDREIAVLGGDGISDRMPARTGDAWPFPIHQIGITGLGLHLIDNLHLEPLAAACTERAGWAFLLTVSPLRIRGGTGCPVNPTAVL